MDPSFRTMGYILALPGQQEAATADSTEGKVPL